MSVGDKANYKGQDVEVTVAPKAGWVSILLSNGDTRKVRVGDLKKPSAMALPPKMRAKDPTSQNPRVTEALKVAKEAKPEPVREAKAPAGPKDNGDEVAAKLRGMDLEQTYAFGAVELAPRFVAIGVDPANVLSCLKSKYGHLNPGQQRMVVGNLIRGYHKELANPKPAKVAKPAAAERAAAKVAARDAKRAAREAAAAAKPVKDRTPGHKANAPLPTRAAA